REGHRAHDLRASAGHGVDDLARRRVDDLVVIRLQANADLLSRHLSAHSHSASYLLGIGRTCPPDTLWADTHISGEMGVPLFTFQIRTRTQDTLRSVGCEIFLCPRPRSVRVARRLCTASAVIQRF